MSEHIGDDAELYALGLLEPERRGEIDAHVVSCDACLRLLGEAEETAASLAGALPSVTPSELLGARLSRSSRPVARSRAWYAGIALAAAMLIALGASWLQIGSLRDKLHAEDLAVATLVHSHFLHVTMTTTPAAGALAAKVVYARDGGWVYVLVDRPGGAVDVVATIDGKPWQGGTAIAADDTATLLLHPPGRPTTIEIRRDGSLLATAKLVY